MGKTRKRKKKKYLLKEFQNGTKSSNEPSYLKDIGNEKFRREIKCYTNSRI
jgi:hypothetical protein